MTTFDYTSFLQIAGSLVAVGLTKTEKLPKMTTPFRLFRSKSDAQAPRGGYLATLQLTFVLAMSHFDHHIDFVRGGMVNHVSRKTVLNEIHLKFKLIGLFFDLIVSEVSSQAFLQESLRTLQLLRHNRHARPRSPET